MFEGVKRHVQDIRYGSIARRKRWLMGLSAIVLVAVLVLWLFVFGVQTAILEKNELQAENDSNAATSFWGSLTGSIQYAKQAFTASMGLIQNLEMSETATTTATATTTILE